MPVGSLKAADENTHHHNQTFAMMSPLALDVKKPADQKVQRVGKWKMRRNSESGRA